MNFNLPINGGLGGLTILRFAHAFESGGGTERYLDDLDQALLERNSMTVIRLHLTRNPRPTAATEERIGRGTLVRVPLPILPDTGSQSANTNHSRRVRFKQALRDLLLYHPLVWQAIGVRLVVHYRLLPQPGQAIGAGTVAAKLFRTSRVGLVIFHYFGGADAEEVLFAARKAGVPTALLNHYSNDRFLHLAIRKHVMLADAVAGVNGLEVPAYVRGGFTNLSDGIDTGFFHCKNARPLKDRPPQPIILLPARVVREKGQMDLVRALAKLAAEGAAGCLAFAGRVDSSDYVDELRCAIARSGLSHRVHFLGNLTMEDLRDWYAASAVVALPTYHHEGLGRVNVEAQAMGIPVVAYATGGVAEGILEGQTGFLLRTGDVAGLTNRLRELLASPSLRAAMGSCGRMLVEEKFSLAALADRHERFYARILAAKSRQSGRQNT